MMTVQQIQEIVCINTTHFLHYVLNSPSSTLSAHSVDGIVPTFILLRHEELQEVLTKISNTFISAARVVVRPAETHLLFFSKTKKKKIDLFL